MIIAHSDLLIFLKIFILCLNTMVPRTFRSWKYESPSCSVDLVAACGCYFVSCPLLCLNTPQGFFFHLAFDVFFMLMLGRPLSWFLSRNTGSDCRRKALLFSIWRERKQFLCALKELYNKRNKREL